MRIARRRFLMITAAAACLPKTAYPKPLWRGIALGAAAQVSVAGTGQDRAILQAIQAELEEVEALFSLYRPTSALSRLNAEGQLRAPPQAFLDLMALCAQAHDASEGRFDPTVQRLWRALATGGDTQAARATLGWEKVRVTPHLITLAPGQALTFNGIAQGYATDRITARLALFGLDEALVHIGEYSARGGPYHIGMVDPNEGLVSTINLSSGTLATSSPGVMRIGGEAHVLGPKGERPLWSTVTVEAAQAALADAASTAFCLMSVAQIERALKQDTGLRAVHLVDAQGRYRRLISARAE
ncbi:MAG: FAD:protein FMN transferase [Pseudomonadota bacterium]